PMAWSLQGAENMAAMRVAVANGESIRKQYLAMQASILFPVEIKEAVQEKLKRLPKRKLLGVEDIDNVPLLRGGHNLTMVSLKYLNEFNVVIYCMFAECEVKKPTVSSHYLTLHNSGNYANKVI